MKRLLVILTAIMLIAISRTLVFAAETKEPNETAPSKNADVRIVHASPDAPAVDIFLDTKPAVEGVKFKDATDFLQVPAGSHQVEVYAAGTKGTKEPVVKATLVVEGGKSYTIAAINKVNMLELKAISNNTVGTPDKANVRVAHFSPDAPAVNVGPKGAAPLFTNLEFKTVSDYQALAPGAYDLSVTTADGKEILGLPGTKVESGKNYTVLAVNTASQLETIILEDTK